MGLVCGSFAIRFYTEGAYQNCGLSDLTPNTNSGLSLGSTYKFKLQVDGSVAQEVVIVVDGATALFGGKNGIVAKINEQFTAGYYDSSSKFYQKKITCGIVNGDLQFKSHSNLTTSAILISQGTATYLFEASTQAGRFPLLGSLPVPVPSFTPADSESESMIFDDGNGNLKSGSQVSGSGTIDYETGQWSLINAPRDAHMQVSVYYNNAFASNMNSVKDNYVGAFYGRSVNDYKKGKIRIVMIGTSVDETDLRMSVPSGSTV